MSACIAIAIALILVIEAKALCVCMHVCLICGLRQNLVFKGNVVFPSVIVDFEKLHENFSRILSSHDILSKRYCFMKPVASVCV